MSNLVIFCDNYLHVLQALRLAASPQYDDITIFITQRESINAFFKAINEKVFKNRLKIVFPSPYISKVSDAAWLKKVWLLVRDVVDRKLYLNNLYKQYFAGRRGDDMVFGPGYMGIECFLLKKLKKKNRWIYYSWLSIESIKKYVPRSLTDFLMLMNVKFVYGWSVSMVHIAGLPSSKAEPFLPDNILGRQVNEIVSWEEAGKLMQDFNTDRFKVFNDGSYKVIYFHDDVIEATYSSIDEQAANLVLEQVFSILNRYFKSQEMATKFTPASIPRPRPQIGEVLPAYVPAELFYNDDVKMYLSFVSAAMSNAVKGLAVSMIDLITFKDNSIKEMYRQSLLQRVKVKILFPKTLEEFEKIAASLEEPRK